MMSRLTYMKWCDTDTFSSRRLCGPDISDVVRVRCTLGTVGLRFVVGPWFLRTVVTVSVLLPRPRRTPTVSVLAFYPVLAEGVTQTDT